MTALFRVRGALDGGNLRVTKMTAAHGERLRPVVRRVRSQYERGRGRAQVDLRHVAADGWNYVRLMCGAAAKVRELLSRQRLEVAAR